LLLGIIIRIYSLTQYMEWVVRGSLFDGDFCPGMKSGLSFTVTSQSGDAPVTVVHVSIVFMCC